MPYRQTLVDWDRRPDLEDVTPPAGVESRRRRLPGDGPEVGQCPILVRYATPVEGSNGSLVLDTYLKAAHRSGVVRGAESPYPARPCLDGRHHARVLLARSQHLGAVQTRVGDALRAYESPRLGGGPTRYAGNAHVAPAELGQQPRDVLGNAGIAGPLDDRSQRPVDVTEHRRARRIPRQRMESLGELVVRDNGLHSICSSAVVPLRGDGRTGSAR